MANPEHLKILLRGVEVWNKWRAENHSIRPDLSHANLVRLNLRQVNLKGVDLSDANIYAAALREARLSGATLNGACLKKADLYEAVFIGAKLGGTDLSETNLVGANLSNCYLNGTDFNLAVIGQTIFGDNDLSKAQGLDTLSHYTPSIIGIYTIYRSGGKIPEIFLRGCGVPDEFITYARSLIDAINPIQFYSCFISYSSKDHDFADRLYADLQNKGVRCWFAPQDLRIGDRIRDSIDESIRLRDKLLLILTENSIGSDWVEQEVESALVEEKQRGRTVLFPIRLDDVVIESNKAWAALIHHTRHIGDFTGWKDHDSYQKAFDRLLRDLKAEEKSCKH